MVDSRDPGKESEAGQMDFQRYLKYWEGREGQMGHSFKFCAVSPHKLVPWEVSCLPGTMLAQPLKWGDNAKEEVGYSGEGEKEEAFRCFCYIPKSGDWQRPPSSESLQGPGRTGAVGQEVGALLTGLMVWVQVSQAKEERRKLSLLSDSPTVDHGSFLEAVLLKSGGN